MIYYEYDSEGFLVGWHEDANRPNSTPIPYAPIPGNRARWADGQWVEDAGREQSAALAAARAAAIVQVQARLDAHAQSWGYDDARSACTYATSKIPRFRAEGTAIMDWRDDTWAAVDQHQNTVTSVEELLALLPAPPARP